MNPLIEYLKTLNISLSEAQSKDFLAWTVQHLFDTYNDTKMKIKVLAQHELDSAAITIPNGTKGEHLPAQTFTLPATLIKDPAITGLEGTGLACEPLGGAAFAISGTPAREGQVDLTITCDYEGRVEGEPLLSRTVSFTINPDPRSLWKDLPTSPDVVFPKKDFDSASIIVREDPAFPGERAKDVAAASRRGRSHANEGKPRDDDFAIQHLDNGWYILAVCDGAGSATYSRRGAEVAAQKVRDLCTEALTDNPDFETAAREYVEATLDPAADPAAAAQASTTASTAARTAAYGILARAALEAHKAVAAVATSNGFPLRDFATTLLLTVAKRYSQGWFVASFWIGDGAIAIYDAPTATVKVMGTPDEGEFAGQTRFLTMTEIFRDPNELFRRVRVEAIPDFTLLALMSDGVSDPMFDTDARLASPQVWEEFRQKLLGGFPADGIPGVILDDDAPRAAEQLLDWLNFWSRGNHDDRTLVILF